MQVGALPPAQPAAVPGETGSGEAFLFAGGKPTVIEVEVERHGPHR